MRGSDPMARYDDDAPSGSALPWFLFGLGLGATLGLLFAPQSGEETRRAIGKKVRKLKHLAEDQLEGVMDTAGKKGRKLREAVAEIADDFGDEDEEELEARPSRAREELERRLAAARARRRGGPAPVGADEDHEEPGA